MTIIEQIKAEIERLYNDKSYSEDRWDMGYDCACEDIMSLLIDLEKSEKPAPKNPEEAAIEYCPDNAYPFGPAILKKIIREAFIAGYNLCREETVEKPVEMGQL